MTETDEVAQSIADKVGPKTLRGLRSMRDAESLVKLYMPDETISIIIRVAERLLAIGRATK